MGSQDDDLYQTYREGAVRISRDVPPGFYDVTLHFAEPADTESGQRLFDIVINDQTVLSSLDVRRARDGQSKSALSVTFPSVGSNDGQLELELRPVAGEPILAAVEVRRPYPRDADWQLVWQDEFDYQGQPDPQKWNIEVWPARKVNDEDQAYTPRAKNVRVENGVLVLEAHKEDFDDASYTSGRVQSMGKGDFLYGRIEVRAKLPRGMGTWPAIWMLPSDPYRYATTCAEPDEWHGSSTCDAWPNSGEIDIMEHVGYEKDHVHGTVHTQAYYWETWQQRKGRIILDGVEEQFHTYVLEWDATSIRTLVDDTLYFTYINEGEGWKVWPFDHPYHLILNLAVGGMWGRAGGGIDDSIFPQRLLIDYVRVYERDAG
ncbi:MAG: family 16 glycosylhydrolase [Gammaproteobacteria bacterium]|nr:family 16 glycosylhydrolase [Gammaproteobacteria bacterium]